MEIVEHEGTFRSDDDTSHRAPRAKRWVDEACEASRRFGKNSNVAHMHKKGLEDTGFLDVREEVYKVLEWLYGEISEC